MKLHTLLTHILRAFAAPKKDNNPPLPDPSIGQAQVRLANLAERQENFFESNVAPGLLDQLSQNNTINRQVADASISSMKQQSDLSQKYSDRYFGTQVPLEDELIAKARGWNEPAEQERMAGQAGADVEQASNVGKQNLQRGLTLRGINLGSGSAVAAMGDMEQNAVLAKAGAVNKTRDVARQMGWQRLGEVAALGRGLPQFGAGSASLALEGGRTASGAAGAGLQGVATAGGVNAQNTATQGGLWGQYGNLGVGSYQTQSANWQNAQNNDPLNAILGAATGVGLNWALKGSDRRLKTDVRRIGQLPSGIPLYSYRYLGDSRVEVGVMADEVAKVIPEAVHRGVIRGGYDAVDYSMLH